jgi:hypothetical protein
MTKLARALRETIERIEELREGEHDNRMYLALTEALNALDEAYGIERARTEEPADA